MNTYKLNFTGRKINAIGKKSNFTEIVTAENAETAKLKLYDNYEHIQVLKVNNKEVNNL